VTTQTESQARRLLDFEAQIENLSEQIDDLEQENGRLRSALDEAYGLCSDLRDFLRVA
jgi:predicted nuclease with TOPRIM domain